MVNFIKNAKYLNVMVSYREGWITFFTPTYNRCMFLHRIYEGLIKQTNKNFVWIVVNDGSTDETDLFIKGLVKKNDIPILYINKDNGGKQSAFKCAFENCKTEYIVCMDDDDYYSESAVNFFLTEWGKINDESIGAIRTLTRRVDGSYISNIPIKKDDYGKIIDVDTLTYNYVYNIRQENWTCYKMSALKRVEIFPSNYWLYEQHKFFTEAIWQGRFARFFKCRYIYISLRTFTTDAEESLTRRTKKRQRYLDDFINKIILFNEQLDYIIRRPRKLLYDIIWVTSVREKLDISFVEFIRNVKSPILKILFVILYPISVLLRKPNVPR